MSITLADIQAARARTLAEGSFFELDEYEIDGAVIKVDTHAEQGILGSTATHDTVVSSRALYDKFQEVAVVTSLARTASACRVFHECPVTEPVVIVFSITSRMLVE